MYGTAILTITKTTLCVVSKNKTRNIFPSFTRGEGSGLYCVLKTIFIPPYPSENDIIYRTLSRQVVFDSYQALFILVLPYLTFILPFHFKFSLYLSSSLPFLSSFLLFLPFPSFSFFLFKFFPQVTSADIPPPRGGRHFPIYRPLFTLQQF
jgi:hypothetical protein